MADEKAKKNYKQTLNLPQTAFPMEAKLVQNEPARLKKWQEMRPVRQGACSRARPTPLWVLHDGPPFANGDIHIGHVINKTLKDVSSASARCRGIRRRTCPGGTATACRSSTRSSRSSGAKLREMSVGRRPQAAASTYADEVRRRCRASSSSGSASSATGTTRT